MTTALLVLVIETLRRDASRIVAVGGSIIHHRVQRCNLDIM